MDYTVEEIIRYENGDMDSGDVLDLFSRLIKCGDAWKLQGAYGRMASRLIEAGYISAEGEILYGQD